MSAELLGVVEGGKNIFNSDILEFGLQGISMLILPRLDLLTQTSWLIYGAEDIGLSFILMQGFFYTGVVLSAALLDMRYRQF